MKSDRSVPTSQRLAKAAAAVLEAEATEGAKTPNTAASRAAAISAIGRGMRMKKQRRRLRWIIASGATALAAAATVALFVGFHHPSQSNTGNGAPALATASFVKGSPIVIHAKSNGVKTSLVDGTSLGAGDRILLEEGSGAHATIALARGTQLRMGDNADVLLANVAPETTFELAAGSVHADVAKLQANERFIVRTADTEVEVRGTSFDVSRTSRECNGTTTRVTVKEGIVAVRSRGHETLLRAGESWPAGCEERAAQERIETPPVVPVSGSASSPPIAVKAPPIGNASPTDLAAQNDLFARALEKKKAGDAAGAVATCEELIARYPNGHLTQSARAERMKLLQSIDASRARNAAREYLQKYPNGFAKADAELILAAPY